MSDPMPSDPVLKTILHRSVWLDQLVEIIDEGPLRMLQFGSHLRQSCMLRARPDHLVLPYTRGMMVPLALQPAPRRILMLGLGGGSMAKFLLHALPDCEIDVVEIIPDLPDLARRYFGVPDTPRLRIRIEDGGHFIRRRAAGGPGQFDLILMDAFNQDGMAATVYGEELLPLCHSLLAPGGVLAANLTYRSASGLSAILHALRSTFTEGGVLTLSSSVTANIVALGLMAPLPKDSAPLLQRARELDATWSLDLQLNLKKMLDSRRPRWKRLLW
ncbi:MAG: spermidine synthase [Magnetococcales bacterium]|nr:spermidine synthase [Magnetococcales bacterium]